MADTRTALQWLIEGKKIRDIKGMGLNEFITLDSDGKFVDERGIVPYMFQDAEWEIFEEYESKFIKRDEFEDAVMKLMSEPKFQELMVKLANK